MTLALNLLGSVTLLADGQSLRLPTRKAGALLACLALHTDEAVPRARLAHYLWPDSENALGNLRAELVRLRKAIGEQNYSSLLKIDRLTITLRGERVESDIRRIQQLLNRCAVHQHPATKGCPICCEQLAQAVDLYHTPLLTDLPSIDSPELDAELEARRFDLEASVLAGLESLQLHLAKLGDHPQVIRYARRHLALRPWTEAPIQRLMMALTLTDARSDALALYEGLQSYLASEFGGAPSAPLTQLYRHIRAGQITPAPATSPTDSAESPYPGLSAFGPNDADNFFGREENIEKLAEIVTRQPLALLTGPSGSGKSSVVYAGLIPALAEQSENGPTDWSVVSFRPGRKPLPNLAQAIYPDLHARAAVEKLEMARLQSGSSLRQIVEEALIATPIDSPADGRGARPRRFLLVADQFEEIFTLSTDEEVRRLLLNELIDTARVGEQSLSVLIVLRADFLGQALDYHSISSIAPEHIHLLGHMSNEQLQQAIEEPARHKGITYEPGLINRILADLDDSPGQLPLLQFALALLWEKRTAQWITNKAYNDIEQVSGALTHYANGIVARLSPAEQKQVRRILLQLVHPGENTEDTRRLASRSEIGEENWSLVHHLADSRLVVTNQDSSGQETVEVIHEALIQKWERLRQWLDEDRAFHLWQSRVRTFLALWLREQRNADALLRGLALAEAERWRQKRGDELGQNLIDFIRISLQARQEEVEKERRRSEALEAALAESRRLERRALARQLGAQADQMMRRKSDLALLLAVEALERSDKAQDRTDLLTTLNINPFLEKILHGHSSPVFYLSYNPDEQILVSSDEHSNIRIWHTDTFASKPLLPPDQTIPDDVALDPTGRWIATVHGKQIGLWSIPTLACRLLVPTHKEDIFRLRFSSEGHTLLSVATDGELCLWNTESGVRGGEMPPVPRLTSLQAGPGAHILAVAEGDGERPGAQLLHRETGALVAPLLLGHREAIHGLAFSSDGARLATASFDGTVRVWDTQTGEACFPALTEHTGRVLFATFSPDGRWLATGGTDNLLLLWDAQTGERLGFQPFQHRNWVRCAVFSPDGKKLFSGDSDGKMYAWNLALYNRLEGHEKRVRVVAVSPDGETLATVAFDSTVGLWDTAARQRKGTLSTVPGREVMAGLFSPDGKTFAAVDNRGELLLWETATWQRQPAEGNPHDEPSIALAFSPDGRLLAQGDLDGYVSLWDTATGALVHPPIRLHTGVASWILTVAFSPDGMTLATGSKDRTIAFWSVPDLAPAGPVIQAHTNWVTYLLYRADGQTLISTSGDGTVRFWNPHTGQESEPPLAGHQGQVWQAEFSPVDGTEDVLVTLGGDGSVLWWDMPSRTPLSPALRTGVETESMALSPDGRRLYLGAFDEKAHVWALSKEPWTTRVRQIANRALTREEWNVYLGKG